MQGEGEDEEDDMFSTNRKFNPNDLIYSGTVSSAASPEPEPQPQPQPEPQPEPEP